MVYFSENPSRNRRFGRNAHRMYVLHKNAAHLDGFVGSGIGAVPDGCAWSSAWSAGHDVRLVGVVGGLSSGVHSTVYTTALHRTSQRQWDEKICGPSGFKRLLKNVVTTKTVRLKL